MNCSLPHTARRALNARSRRARGFTLVEMLVVIAIISILMAMILGAIAVARRASREKATDATLILLDSALKRYEMDFQDFPPSDGDTEGIHGSENLYRCLRTEKKEGPYITPADVQTTDSDKNGTPEIRDAFGGPIRYVHHRDYANQAPNKRTYRLMSDGPNAQFEHGARGTDDIVNWNKDKPE
jgi:prepilin-type N-terminal cleavage/methylation domain-containing protein